MPEGAGRFENKQIMERINLLIKSEQISFVMRSLVGGPEEAYLSLTLPSNRCLEQKYIYIYIYIYV